MNGERMDNSDLFKYNDKYFGEVWASEHLMKLIPTLHKPNTTEYDLEYGDEKIEAKASRVRNRDKIDEYHNYAPMRYGEEGTWRVSFNRIKGYADTFIFILVWLDKIKYFLMTKDEVFNFVHRTARQGRGSPDEFLISISNTTYKDLEPYEVSVSELRDIYR